VARDRGDAGSAEKRYEDMLDKNPGYIPALLGLADLKWANGQRGEALTLYRQVVRAAPGSDWASHAQARIDEAQSSPTSKPAASGSAPKPPPPPPPAGAKETPEPPPAGSSSSDLPPHVDVSDLPEYQ
jgi:hypothetical protein